MCGREAAVFSYPVFCRCCNVAMSEQELLGHTRTVGGWCMCQPPAQSDRAAATSWRPRSLELRTGASAFGAVMSAQVSPGGTDQSVH